MPRKKTNKDLVAEAEKLIAEEPKTDRQQFNQAYRALCERHGIDPNEKPPEVETIKRPKILSAEQVSELSDLSVWYIKALEKTNMLDRACCAAEVLVPKGGQREEVEAYCKAHGGAFPVSMLKRKRQSAETTFRNWYKQPIGRDRLTDGRTIRSCFNSLFNLPADHIDDHSRQITSRNVLVSNIKKGAPDLFEQVREAIEA